MIEVNIVAVLTAAVSSMVVGFLWYSPLLFAKPWMTLMGYTESSMKEAQKGMMKMYGLSFIASIITAYVLFHVMTLSQNFFQYSLLATGLNTAFWMWLGFIAPVQLTDVLFGSKKVKLFLINTGYQLVSLLVMGIAIALVV